MALNEVRLGAAGARQGKVIFQNGKLRLQAGTAPAWTDYITVDSNGLLALPAATAVATGLMFGTDATLYRTATGIVTADGGYNANTWATGYLIGGVAILSAAGGTDTTLAAMGANGSIIFKSAANGQLRNEAILTELTTIAAAATTDTAIQIPANAVVLAVSVRVTVLIPTAATFTVKGTTSATQFDVAGGVAVAAGTTDVGTASCPYKNGAAQTIRITPNLTPADTTGRVRVTIHYYTITPATS